LPVAGCARVDPSSTAEIDGPVEAARTVLRRQESQNRPTTADDVNALAATKCP